MSAAEASAVAVVSMAVGWFMLEERVRGTVVDVVEEALEKIVDHVIGGLREWLERVQPRGAREVVAQAERLILESVERLDRRVLGKLFESIDVDRYVEHQVDEFSRKVDELYTVVYGGVHGQHDKLLDAILQTLTAVKMIYMAVKREKRLLGQAVKAAAILAALTALTSAGRYARIVEEMPGVAREALGEVIDVLAGQ